MLVQLANNLCLTWSSYGTISTTKFSSRQCRRNMKTFLSIFCARIATRWVFMSSMTSDSILGCFPLKVSNVKFHVVGLKCQNSDCGGYNTTRTHKSTESNNKAPGVPGGGGSNNDDASPSSSANNNVAWFERWKDELHIYIPTLEFCIW